MSEVRKLSAYRIKRNTVIFSVAVGLLNVVFMLAMLLVMFIVAAFVIYKIFRCESSLPVQIAMPVILVAGFVLDFIFSVKIIRLVIIAFNLKDKINPKVADQYLYNKKHPKPAE